MLLQRGVPSAASARSPAQQPQPRSPLTLRAPASTHHPYHHHHHHHPASPTSSSVRAAAPRSDARLTGATAAAAAAAAAAADLGTGDAGPAIPDVGPAIEDRTTPPGLPCGCTPLAHPASPLAPRTPDLDSPRPQLPGSGRGPTHRRPAPIIRRDALLRLAATAVCLVGGGGVLAVAVAPDPAAALPLGPLGPVKRVGGEKRTGLTAEQVAEVLRRDLAVGQYFVTGDLTREVFADDCRFVDPTNDVTGLSKYLTALGVLFDPQYSKVELLDIRPTGPRTVEADWRLGGYLVFPWNPRVEPFQGHTVYTLNAEGLVSEQRQTWSISAATALVESFTPTWGPRRQLF